MSSESVVRLRPDKVNWIGVAFFAFALLGVMAIFVSAPNTRHDTQLLIQVGLFCGLIFLLPACLAAWLLVYRIEADNNGLRWRTIRGLHHAAWADVTDYYVRISAAGNKSHDSLVIKTLHGTLQIGSGWSGDAAAFKRLVEQQATQSRCSSWQLQSNRLELDGLKHFDYRSGDAKMRQVMLPLAFAIGPIATLCLIGPKIPAAIHDPERTYTFLMMGMLALRLNLVSLVGLMTLPAVRDSARRRNQRIVVSVEGIACEEVARSEAGIAFLPWSEIHSLKILPGRRFGAPAQYLVEGATGSITFTSTIHPLRLLTTIVAARATGIPEDVRKWKYAGPNTEDLGGVAAKWTGGCEGVGERVFHYRTRTTRALLLFAGFFLSATQIGALRAALGLNDQYVFDWESIVWFVVPATLLAYLCWRYRAGGIVVSTTGITERKPFGTRTLRWADVESYRRSSDDSMPFAILQSHTGKRLRFYMGISDVDELTSLIAARATKATGSWQSKNAMTDSQPTRAREL